MPTLTERAHDGAAGDPTQPDRPRRRRFSSGYKLAILADYDRPTMSGDKGALLRRDGLYSSQIVEWRRARDAGALHPTRTTSEQPNRAATSALAKANQRADRAEGELAKTRRALESADSDPKPTS